MHLCYRGLAVDNRSWKTGANNHSKGLKKTYSRQRRAGWECCVGGIGRDRGWRQRDSADTIANAHALKTDKSKADLAAEKLLSSSGSSICITLNSSSSPSETVASLVDANLCVMLFCLASSSASVDIHAACKGAATVLHGLGQRAASCKLQTACQADIHGVQRTQLAPQRSVAAHSAHPLLLWLAGSQGAERCHHCCLVALPSHTVQAIWKPS